MKLDNCSPFCVDPHNSPKHSERLRQLEGSLQQSGWNGRPVLVIRGSEDSELDFVGLTGSHRILAARNVNLLSIPIAIVDGDVTIDDFQTLPYRQYVSVLASFDPEAADLFALELNQDSHPSPTTTEKLIT
jgi:hypothetical protein